MSAINEITFSIKNDIDFLGALEFLINQELYGHSISYECHMKLRELHTEAFLVRCDLENEAVRHDLTPDEVDQTIHANSKTLKVLVMADSFLGLKSQSFNTVTDCPSLHRKLWELLKIYRVGIRPYLWNGQQQQQQDQEKEVPIKQESEETSSSSDEEFLIMPFKDCPPLRSWEDDDEDDEDVTQPPPGLFVGGSSNDDVSGDDDDDDDDDEEDEVDTEDVVDEILSDQPIQPTPLRARGYKRRHHGYYPIRSRRIFKPRKY